MRELLHLLPKPAYYTGSETGSVHKDASLVKLRIALAFPDIYEVGMSYLGQKILYGIVNANPDWWAERVMAPERAACDLLRQKKMPLCTLESDTPLGQMAAIGFSVTHELCYTDILNMLDLAGIPLRAADRSDDLFAWPLIIAGGGAMLGAEPISPFLDLVALGDGEELLPEILALLERARGSGIGKREFLLQAARIPGVYVPAFFHEDPAGGYRGREESGQPVRRIVPDLNACAYPVQQIAPLGAVHNRLSLEIGRGCTRGCRFCHAGMVYRPARERDPEKIQALLRTCLSGTGFDEVSLLALSAGDCTALRTIYEDAFRYCQKGQTTLCLPSLRVGSVDDAIMAQMAEIRRPGATLAPEAGSQRLRDIINKGVTEEELLLHVQKLLEHGWRQVKLYFMIGLPGETDADLDAIVSLCKKVREAGGAGAPKMAVTAAVSPFVPKPFTPFQWEGQLGLEEISRRINYLREKLRSARGIRLKWHEPASSHLEGILARGDRRLADVIELAFRKGAIFCGWSETFDFAPWQEALVECGLSAEEYIRPRRRDEILPWSHIEAGVSQEFLWREREKALAGKVTPDCKFGECAGCGACDIGKNRSRLAGGGPIGHRLVFRERDQKGNQPLRDNEGRLVLRQQPKPALERALIQKAVSYRVWHQKKDGASWLSHLELQALLARALRRADIPVSFSQGYHPMPLISFGRALPVGVESEAEWFGLTLASLLAPDRLRARLARFLPAGLVLGEIEIAPKKTEISVSETFAIESENGVVLEQADAFGKFSAQERFPFSRVTKKGEKTEDLRPYLLNWKISASSEGSSRMVFTTDWSESYVSPLVLARAILGYGSEERLRLCKLGQSFENGSQYSLARRSQ
ncbi:MAG: TIGR03960 family B12-binding radical SAM protein [Desulfovibrio sp.]|nr:TIGR03960 family B12-binding radical SAM protein [Desulfovibrio sp.]